MKPTRSRRGPFSLVLGALFAAAPVCGQYTVSTVVGSAPTPTPAIATRASFSYPCSVALAPDGSFYFAAGQNFVYKVDPNGVMTRVAGRSKVIGYSGDGGPAADAQFYSIAAVALDLAGNLYVADLGNSVIRKITPDGIITTIAGNGQYGYSGDGGPAVKARLNEPCGIAVDAAGNVYIADYYNYRVRKVSVDGIISTVAGSGGRGFSGDGGPATKAQIYGAQGVGLDPAGNLYIADYWNHRVRRVTADGIITTIAGSSNFGYGGDGGPATDARLYLPSDVAVDGAGNIYIADSQNGRIRRVDGNGIITTIAGGGAQPGTSGTGGTALLAGLSDPLGIAVDPDGNILIAEVGGNVVRWVSASDNSITTLAGNGVGGYSGDGGPAIAAQISGPQSIARDSLGNLYFAETKNNIVRKISVDGTISTFAGTGAAGYSGDGGPAIQSRLRSPFGVAVDAAGNVYIGDENYAVRKVDANGVITTVAGNGQYDYAGGTGDGGPATSAPLQASYRIALDTDGNLYIAEGARLRKVMVDGTITTVAGTGKAGYSGDGGPALNAQVDCTSVTIAPSGEIYFSDFYHSVVRKIALDGTITTVAGNGTYGYGGDDGPAIKAALRAPGDLAVDAAGNIYITDSSNYNIRKVDSNGMISRFSGSGASGTGFPEDGTNAKDALLFEPTGITVDGSGNIYVSDTGCNAVFVFRPAAMASIALRDAR